MSDQQQRDAAADLTICNAATDGPWELCDDVATDLDGNAIWAAVGRTGVTALMGERVRGGTCHDYDLVFATVAREALPWWIAEAERLRAEPTPLARLEAWAAVTPGRRYRIEPGRVCLTAVVAGHDLDIRDAYATAGRPMPGLSPSGKRVYLPDSATTGELILAALAKWEELYGDAS